MSGNKNQMTSPENLLAEKNALQIGYDEQRERNRILESTLREIKAIALEDKIINCKNTEKIIEKIEGVLSDY